MASAIDVTGERYGRLVALRRMGYNRHKQAIWEWQCDCGAVVSRLLMNVRRRCTRSCGCLHAEERRGRVRNRLPFGESSFRGLWKDYVHRAARSGRGWTLTSELFRRLTSSPCHYCGLEPRQVSLASPESNGAYIYNGLDRADNSRGYEPDNVVPCCIACNRGKGVMTEEEFLAWVDQVSAFQAKKATSIGR